MYVQLNDWVDCVQREYLNDFIPQGGAAVKFAVVPSLAAAREVHQELRNLARAMEYQVAYLDSSTTKIHMVDQLFHQVARQIDWNALARSFVRELLVKHGFDLPETGELHYRAIAERNNYEESELRRDVRDWLRDVVFKDFAMAQDFRIAMLRLCQAQLEPTDSTKEEADAIIQWLRGELRLISTLKSALIFQKIARHNARDMFLSLAHWLRVVDKQGLVLVLDIARYTSSQRPSDGSLYHTTTAAKDAYEVLRQFIDATDELESCFIVVTAPADFLVDQKRGVETYDPLKLRIWDEVRDRSRANPLASLVRIQTDSTRTNGYGGGDA